MPAKKSSGPARRAQLGPIEKIHLLGGFCQMPWCCSICPPDAPKCALEWDLARALWNRHREELLAEWNDQAGDGWGWLTPRIPAAAEVWFDGVPMPKYSDKSWPERAFNSWILLNMWIHEERMAAAQLAEDVATWEQYERALAWFTQKPDIEKLSAKEYERALKQLRKDFNGGR